MGGGGSKALRTYHMTKTLDYRFMLRAKIMEIGKEFPSVYRYRLEEHMIIYTKHHYDRYDNIATRLLKAKIVFFLQPKPQYSGRIV